LDVGNLTNRTVTGLTGSTTYYYRVRAYNGNGTSGNSNVISVTTSAAGQVATPTFSPDGGVTDQHTIQVFIQTATAGAQISYTINDPTPPSRTHGTIINGSSGWVTLSVGFVTLRAMAFKNGMTDSGVHEAEYEYDNGRSIGTYPLDNAGLPPAGPVEPDLAGTFVYTLDKAGNRTAVSGVDYSPNSINQYTSVGGTAVTNGTNHQIQTYGGFTYTYMRDQELKQVTAAGFTYDFAYDALGRCVKRTVVNYGSTVYYIYQGDKPILEYNENNALVGFNVYGKGIDEIVERRAYGADNQWYRCFLNQDHEGSVTHLTDADGTIIEKYRYDVFGTPSFYNGGGGQISTTAYNNRFLFTGREYLGAWVYDYRARLYHAYLGRFMSEDPKLFDAGDYNLFRYCHNDPIDMTDPMGLANETVGITNPRQESQWKADITNAERISLSQKSMESSIGGELAYQNLQSANMVRAGSSEKGRPLTRGETNEARGVFHQKIKYDPVRVVAGKYVPWQPNNIAITPDNRIFWPKAPPDLIEEGTMTAGRFIHEMTHVMQYQHGVNVVLMGGVLQTAYYASGRRLYNPYRYHYDANRPFSSYNIEAQGEIAERIYRRELPNNIDYSDVR
jgi:RHS repeat-associated protein